MKKLNFYQVSDVDDLAWPKEMEGMNLTTPALAFFTDFAKTQPLFIESTVSAVEVKKLMQKAHVRMKLVVNTNRQFIGIITSDDLIDRKIVQKISEGFKREDISVTDLMTSKKSLRALDFQEVSKATIRDVINTLKNSGQQHCLVIDRGDHKIRGIFSASDISRKLHLPIDIEEKSDFYKVFSVAS